MAVAMELTPQGANDNVTVMRTPRRLAISDAALGTVV